MKKIDPSVYDENYYLNVCLGSEEFKKSGGKSINTEIKDMLKDVPLKKDMRVLDVGCGRGDINLYIGRKVKESVGIDYSKTAIKIANNIKKDLSNELSKKLSFKLMNATNLDFEDNYYDLVIAIDIFEHLTPKELSKCISEVKRVLKPNGILFVHTGTNKLLYDVIYKNYTLPLNKFITKLDKKIFSKNYPSLPKDPRTKEEKKQHVNEPTYKSLQTLFSNNNFDGKIKTRVGYIKKGNSVKTKIYNFLIALYPLSFFYPLNRYFGWAFICIMRNRKD
jgi:ubiquinone/menaquinone biosynthesis C-methylase UbiE